MYGTGTGSLWVRWNAIGEGGQHAIVEKFAGKLTWKFYVSQPDYISYLVIFSNRIAQQKTWSLAGKLNNAAINESHHVLQTCRCKYIYSYLTKAIFLRTNCFHTSCYQFEFRGIRGFSYTSDIAVDDIVLLPGKCDDQTIFSSAGKFNRSYRNISSTILFLLLCTVIVGEANDIFGDTGVSKK